MDVGRLLRLALLYANDEPKTAWKYLGEAYAKDPQNPDIRSYRAKLLETVGKNNQAHQEYLAAVKLQPSNLFLKEQLAEFYLRKKQYPMALQVYEENLSPPSLDTIWMKAWFWNRVTHPINFDWNKAAIPQGALDDLVTYAIQLKPGVFWDRQKFDRVKNGKFYLKNQQEIYWLRLLQDLKEGNENNAVSLLKYNPFHSTSWDPALENALKRILAYRKTGFFDVEEANIPNDHLDPHAHDVDLPPFFQEIEELANLSHANVLRHKVPDDLHELLISKEVFAVAFLSAGWLEAGLNLRALTHIPEQLPEWVSVMEAKALEQNRSFLEALEYAEVQPHTPALTLFAAELLISGGDALRALEKLKGLVKLESDIGYRAAWLSSLIYLENNDYNNARTVIYAQPLLVNDQLGQETLAQIAHEEGDHELAGRLYVSLEDKSSQKARELTEQLIQDYPDDPMLKDNLLKIEKAARKSRNAPMNHAKGTVLRSLKPKKRS
jgi:hypothetical protein